MLQRKIEVLGEAGYSRSITPLRRVYEYEGCVIGFDTEYTSGKNELVSVQLSNGKESVFLPIARGVKLTPQWLYREVCRLVGYTPDSVLLITFFSLAELQFLPVLKDGYDVREYARGSLDVSFEVSGGAELRVYDLARWYDGRGLAAAAASLGLEKKEWNTRHVTRRDLQSACFREYAKHDAWLCFEIFRQLRSEFLRVSDVDIVNYPTPASAAAATFRRRFVKSGRIYCDVNAARHAALRGAWGGRAEAFKRGRLGVLKEYDISSAYPASVIALGTMPTQKTWRALRSLKGKWCGGFAHVRFSFPAKCRYPLLPVEVKGALIFPLQGETWATLAELEVARDMGARVELLEGYGYNGGTSILADFMTWAIEERRKASGAGKTLFKLLANSLTGKLAQCVRKVNADQMFKLAEELDINLDAMLELPRDSLEAMGLKPQVSVGPIFMPEWNGLITGYTRATLARMVNAAKGPVYCHTDSVWCKSLPEADYGLRYEEKARGEAVVVRARFGCLGEKPTLAHVKAGTVHLAHHSVWNVTAACQMLARFDGEAFNRTYPIRRPLKLREAAAGGDTPGRWVQEWLTASTKWDYKRVLHSDGSTSPWQDSAEYLKTAIPARKNRA